jgi:hypothetical protein
MASVFDHAVLDSSVSRLRRIARARHLLQLIREIERVGRAVDRAAR